MKSNRPILHHALLRIIALSTLFLSAGTASALDSSDLLFHLSFEDGVAAEFSRGASQPISQPQDLPNRLVEGVIGNGYGYQEVARQIIVELLEEEIHAGATPKTKPFRLPA